MTDLPAARRHVALLATGGTIACLPGPDGRLVPGLSSEELVASVPGLEDAAVTPGSATSASAPRRPAGGIG